jgi:ribosomal protein L7/L12
MNTNVPQETIRALRSFLWTHGIATSIAALADLTREFGPQWADVSEQIEGAIVMVPPTSLDDRAALLGTGKIRISYSDNGTKIEIIKAVRCALKIGLKEAKDYTEIANLMGVVGDLGVLAALNAEMDRRGLTERFTME